MSEQDKKSDKNSDETSSAELDIDLAGGASALIPVNKASPQTLEALAEAGKQISRMREPHQVSANVLDKLKLIYPDMSDKKVLNAYRDLRTKLFQLGKLNNFIVMVTCVTPTDDASNVAINIGSAFAFDSTKTALIIDCNLSSPTLNKYFNVETDVGLTNFLEDETVSLDKIIYPTGVHRLRFIPVGKRKETVSEYFTSIRMRQFLHTVKKRYADRFILIDSPCIADSADAKILAELCDFVLLVVPYAKISESKLTQIVESIDKSKLAGVIFSGN